MTILLTGINYQLNEQQKTTSIAVTYQKYENQNSFSATAVLEAEDVKSGTLDNLNKEQIDALARVKIVGWLETTAK